MLDCTNFSNILSGVQDLVIRFQEVVLFGHIMEDFQNFKTNSGMTTTTTITTVPMRKKYSVLNF